MKYRFEEMMAADIAHTISDGEVGFTGLATGKAATTYIMTIPLVAMELAKRTHAPNLTILLCGWSHNPDISKLRSLPESEFERDMADLSCEAQMNGWPAQWNHRAGDISFAFGSGVQVDREGNINSTCVGDPRKPKVELVGPIFLPEHFSCFGREYIMMPHHEVRSFVEKVDHISGVGFPGGMEGRKKLNLPGGGPKYIYTPRCVFSFNDAGEIYLRSVHPGVSVDEVTANTGFSFSVPETTIPTDEEIRIIREEIDVHGILFPQE